MAINGAYISEDIILQTGQHLQTQIDLLSETLKGYKWRISREEIGKHIVENRIQMVTIYALLGLSMEIYGQELPGLVQQAKKVATNREIIDLLRNPQEPDPRLKDLHVRIARLNKPGCLHKETKIKKYDQFLSQLALSDQTPRRTILVAQIQLLRASLNVDCPNEQPLEPATDDIECISPIIILQQAINALSLQSLEGFAKALDNILDLEPYTLFSYAGYRIEEKKVMDRIFFHTQSIHNKETTEKADQNNNYYESNAFLSQEKSTPQERLCAVQRTQIEMCLYTLKEAIKGDLSIESPVAGKATIPGIFEILENLNLDPKDLPKDQKNLAHALFGELYHAYLAAWEKDKSMIHPHDKSFKNDFGRNAFVNDPNSVIHNAYKLQAINEIAQSLREVWGI